MITTQEALKMAIELMERFLEHDGISSSDYIDVLEACKEALEQPAQEIGEAEIRQMLNDIEYYQKRVEELEQPLTRDWKETIDERIAKDNEFKEALAQPIQHKWSADGERCVKCGDKDWMGGSCSVADEQPAQEPVAWIKQGMDGYPKLVFNGKFEYESIAAKWDDIALYTKEKNHD